ncbi:hypothetical protein C9I98_18005 [Photobacterium sanctipauli]|uniref:Carboxypeptidase Q n=1 Tax=Photobacterium sanctipauli TaxID=1342794 RepID=A0A2T3NP08_9GAMM|nr:M20/M25/M40 family metallo-hydrolase [Photobacterium sanctipauli]PSW17991.1 hypothetical protein C9I98_18005 [Photobacterium sanctipauli]
MDHNRRSFLKKMGYGAGAVAMAPALSGCNFFDTLSKSDVPTDAIPKMVELWEHISSSSIGHEKLGEFIDTFGTRMVGTQPLRDSEEYCINLFGEIGISPVEPWQFKAQVWNRNTCTVEIERKESGVWEPLDVICFARSPDETLISEDSEAELVYVGDFVPDNSISTTYANKVILATGAGGDEKLGRGEKAERFAQHGALALIIINKRDVLNAAGAGIPDSKRAIAIPALNIKKTDGEELRDYLLERGSSPIKIKASITNKNWESKEEINIVAELQGSEKPDEIIVVGGHIDSWDLGPGAVDNGSGCFTIIDIANAFMQIGYQPKRTIHFVLFGAEEQGMMGSEAYIAEMTSRGLRENLKYYVNIDMSGNAKGFNTFGVPEAKQMLDNLGEVIREIYPEYINENRDHMVGFGSDQRSFLVDGVPSLNPYHDMEIGEERLQEIYHTHMDTMDKISVDDVKRHSQIIGTVIMRLCDEPLPRARFSDAELPFYFRKFGKEAELRKKGLWKDEWDHGPAFK